MKSVMKTVLTAVLALVMLCGAALAESADPSLKYDNVWMAEDGTRIEAYPEGEGFYVEVRRVVDYDKGTGYIWEVKCYYNNEEDMLKAVSAIKHDAVTEDGTLMLGENILYEDIDNTSTFFINEDGKLIWFDSKEDSGVGLQFVPVGHFEGIWPGVNSNATIMWADEFYTVYVSVWNEEGQLEEYTYNGFYNKETDQLEATGTCDVITYDENKAETGRTEYNEGVEAVFHIDADGNLVWENLAPQGVKTNVFQNQINASMDSENNG